MKRMKKFFVLLSVLIAGFSYKGANDTNKMVVADAAEVGSYAYFSIDWKTEITTALSSQGVNSDLFQTILITNDGSKVPMSGYLEGCPVEVGLKGSYTPANYYTNGCAVGAYVYPNATDATMFDCILYADVETIYPNSGRKYDSSAYDYICLFSKLSNVEKITFDFINNGKFSMANASDHNMYHMFASNKKLAQIDGLEYIDTTGVTNMGGLFGWCNNLVAIHTLDGKNWNTSSVTNMSWMFYNCEKLQTLDVSNFDTSKVTLMYDMFGRCKSLAKIEGIENFDTSSVTDMSGMFGTCSNLTELDVSHFDTTNVTNMSVMFSSCASLTELDVSNFDTTNVTNMSGMFSSCASLTELDVSHFDTTNVTNMNVMFSSCASLTELDVSHFNTSKVTRMDSMFLECKNITAIKGLENFDTSKVTNMKYMFNYCNSLTTLDLSSFDLSSITDQTNLNNFIANLSRLTEIKVPKNLNGLTIQLPGKFGMTEIDPSMEGWTLLQGSKEFNALYNTLMKINVCTEYAQAPELQAMYDGLVNEEKEKLATLTDDGGVILTDKLSYMVSYADYKANEATMTSGSHLVLSAKTGQYLVIVIACLSLSLIGGYYLLQKRKYAK